MHSIVIKISKFIIKINMETEYFSSSTKLCSSFLTVYVLQNSVEKCDNAALLYLLFYKHFKRIVYCIAFTSKQIIRKYVNTLKWKNYGLSMKIFGKKNCYSTYNTIHHPSYTSPSQYFSPTLVIWRFYFPHHKCLENLSD